MKFSVATAIVVLSFLVVACGTVDKTPQDPAEGDPPRVSMLDSQESASSLPAGCSFSEVQNLFTEFLEGGNDRNRSKLIRRVASQPELNAFTLDGSGPDGKAARYGTPKEIFRFFANQSRLGFTRNLLQGEISSISPGTNPTSPFRRPAQGPAADDPVVSIGFALDLRKNGKRMLIKAGKGAINCQTGQFYVFNGG